MKSKADILTELEASRRHLAADVPALAHSLNPVGAIKRSLQRHPAGWIVGSAVLGLAGAKVLSSSRRRKKLSPEKKPSSKSAILPLLSLILKTVVRLARPSAEKIIQERLTQKLD